MAEHLERMEAAEQVLNPELCSLLAENYMIFCREAAAGGHTDMARYYREKAAQMETPADGKPELPAPAEQSSGAGTDMKAYYEAKKLRLQEEQQERQQQWRMDKAVHGAPDYSGFGGWRESEYIYEAEKEYARNGNSAEYRRLMEGAAKAHVRETYRDILE